MSLILNIYLGRCLLRDSYEFIIKYICLISTALNILQQYTVITYKFYAFSHSKSGFCALFCIKDNILLYSLTGINLLARAVKKWLQ